MNQFSTQSKNILLADDDSDDCMIFEEALKEVNAQTQLTIESDGHSLLLELLQKSYNHQNHRQLIIYF